MIKKQKYLLAFFILIFSQQSLFCSDDVPWYRTFKAGLAVGSCVTAYCIILELNRAHNKACVPRHDFFAKRTEELVSLNAQLQEQVTSMGVLVAAQARDLSYVRRLNKVLLQMERAAIPAQAQNKNDQKLSAILREKKKVSFKEMRKEKHRGR